MSRIGGIISVATNGTRLDAKGSFSWNLGIPVRENIIGQDRAHGYKETPQTPFIEGEVSVTAALDVVALLELQDATVSLDLPNGKTVVLNDAFAAMEGTGQTEEGNLPVRFEGSSADYV